MIDEYCKPAPACKHRISTGFLFACCRRYKTKKGYPRILRMRAGVHLKCLQCLADLKNGVKNV